MSYVNTSQLVSNRTILVTFVSRLHTAAQDPVFREAVKEAAPNIAGAAKSLVKVVSAFRGAWRQS